MMVAGVSYLAILAAAVAAWLAGAIWYMAFGKYWMAALGTTREEMRAYAAEIPGRLERDGHRVGRIGALVMPRA